MNATLTVPSTDNLYLLNKVETYLKVNSLPSDILSIKNMEYRVTMPFSEDEFKGFISLREQSFRIFLKRIL